MNTQYKPVTVRIVRSRPVRVNANANAAGASSVQTGVGFRRHRVAFRVNQGGGVELVTPGVSVITCTHRPHSMEQVLANYLRQTYGRRELIIVLNGEGMDLGEWQARVAAYPDIRVFQLDAHLTLGDCLNFAVDQARYDYLARFDDDDYYAPHYLAASMSAFSQTHAGVVGKCSIYVYFESRNLLAIAIPDGDNRYSQGVAGATMVVRKSVFDRVRFPSRNQGEDNGFMEECVRQGIPIYSTDRFNYVYIRRSDRESHTWQVEEEEYLRYCQPVMYTDDYITPTTVVM